MILVNKFISDLSILPEIIQKSRQDIIPFELKKTEKHYTKRDAFVLMNCDTKKYTEYVQRVGGYILCKNTSFTRSFFAEFEEWARDDRIITDIPNQCGYPNYDGFVAHRHDQSIYSLLTKKYNLDGFRDPSQFGNKRKAFYSNSNYDQLIDSTRRKEMPLVHKIVDLCYKKLARIYI